MSKSKNYYRKLKLLANIVYTVCLFSSLGYLIHKLNRISVFTSNEYNTPNFNVIEEVNKRTFSLNDNVLAIGMIFVFTYVLLYKFNKYCDRKSKEVI